MGNAHSSGSRASASRVPSSRTASDGEREQERQRQGRRSTTASKAAAASNKKGSSKKRSQKRGGDGTIASTSTNSGFLTERRFTNADVRPHVSDATLRALKEVFGHERLTKVQAATFSAIVSGADVFAKSKTGSGKTMAFLLPLMYRIKDGNAASIRSVVVSPTKELAAQTHQEAAKLLTFDPSGARAVLVVGGQSKGADLQAFRRGNIAVLVATPGRLQDHVQSTPGFRESLAAVRVAVLDEADRMLDAGFKRPIEAILAALPPQRQTVLVSATVGPEVLRLAQGYLRPGWKSIDVAALSGDKGDDDVGPRVNPSVKHRTLVLSHEQAPHHLLRVICAHVQKQREQKRPFKIIVFLPFVKQVVLMTALFRQMATTTTTPSSSCLRDVQLLEIHSDLAQPQRNRMADAFRASPGAVLFGTDVVARGVDFPGVSLVVQWGMTDGETYVHRVGRTGRAGQEGEAMMLLTRFEEPAMRRQLKDLGVQWMTTAQAEPEMAEPEKHTELMAASRALQTKEPALFRRAATAWVGTYASRSSELGISKPQVEEEAKAAFAALGFTDFPEISPEVRKKMGFR